MLVVAIRRDPAGERAYGVADETGLTAVGCLAFDSTRISAANVDLVKDLLEPIKYTQVANLGRRLKVVKTTTEIMRRILTSPFSSASASQTVAMKLAKDIWAAMPRPAVRSR